MTTVVISFSGLPSSSIHNLQRVQNCAAHLILKKPHPVKLTTSLLCFNLSTGFQSIPQRIQYKINTLCYKCSTCTAPSFLCDCLQLYTPSRTFRSASDALSFQIPRTRLSTFGSWAFSVFGPSTWNVLSFPLRKKPYLDSFKSNLKTLLFPKAIDPPPPIFFPSRRRTTRPPNVFPSSTAVSFRRKPLFIICLCYSCNRV